MAAIASAAVVAGVAGGRDRDGQRPVGADTGAAQEPVSAEADGVASVGEDGEFEPAQPGAALGENGEPRRKRRRRRGRRGGRERGDRPEGAENQQGGFVAAPDRFGPVPDEIDTTPSNTPYTPGAPSAPVWSLKDDVPDTTPSDDAKPQKKGWWQKAFGGE